MDSFPPSKQILDNTKKILSAIMQQYDSEELHHIIVQLYSSIIANPDSEESRMFDIEEFPPFREFFGTEMFKSFLKFSGFYESQEEEGIWIFGFDNPLD